MSQKREIIAVPAKSDLPFSTVVGFQSLVFVSGIVGRDARSGAIAAGDVYAQTRQTLSNIGELLAKAGAGPANVLKATVFITDMRRFKEMNRAYLEFFPAEKPARSCVAVTALPDADALVEIEVIAHR
jgi:2-iminobutanoate/2-iminopropanoate deaminase